LEKNKERGWADGTLASILIVSVYVLGAMFVLGRIR
jgi:hypothetical protein